MEKLIIETSNFWKDVRSEYIASKTEFVCNGSPTFETAWNNHRQEIYDIAEAFIHSHSYSKEYSEIHTGMGFLFTLTDYTDRSTESIISANKQIRQEFLIWCVELYN